MRTFEITVRLQAETAKEAEAFGQRSDVKVVSVTEVAPPALPIRMDGQSHGPKVMDAVREVARRTVAEHGDDAGLRFFVTYSFAVDFGADGIENWSRDRLQGVMAEHCVSMLDQGHEPESWELHEAGKV
jgi:hypothetical protein